MEEKVVNEFSGSKTPTAQTRFPRIVLIIILTEFCERFSYSGMRAFLTLYLRSKLGYTDEEATETYHIFSACVYVFPIIGGIIADNYLGKFRTILYMMFVYAAGNFLVAISAIPHLPLPGRLCTMLGLLMITLGTGGIKPCVTAFGGDQIKPEQERYLALYFSVLYFTLCTGSLIAKTVSPILRSEIHCFGDKDCYSLAFGAPGLIILVSIVIFVSARRRYVMKEPEGNIVIDFVKCLALGIKNLAVRGRDKNDSHWLDSARPRYDRRFVRDVKKTLNIFTLFTVLPVFYTLLDQMGSRWTLQASKMDGRLGFVTIKPDQMQVLAPIFILIFIPLSQKFIYPFLAKRNILRNPLHKLTLGGVLAGVAFISSAVVEIYLKTTYPILPQPNYSQLRIFNGNPCSVAIQNDEQNITYTIPAHSYFVNRNIHVNLERNLTFEWGGSCIEPRAQTLSLMENKAISYVLDGGKLSRFIDNVDKSKSGLPVARFLVTDRVNVTNLSFYNERRDELEVSLQTGVSPQTEVFASTYSVRSGDDMLADGIEMDSGGVYTVIVDWDGVGYKTNVITLTAANSITMAWLLPQFLIMAIGEVLFAVTGSEFAFKESPESMKAVMTAIWLLTEAVGNVIIIVITRLFVNYQQETQSFIYTGMMFAAITVFHFLSRGYRFGHADDDIEMYHPVKQQD